MHDGKATYIDNNSDIDYIKNC